MVSCESCDSQNISRISVRLGLAYWCCKCCGHCTIDHPSGIESGFVNAQYQYFGSESLLMQKTLGIFDREILLERKLQACHYIPLSSHVLEVGPGAGHFASLLKEMGHHVALVEHSPELATALAQHLGVPIYVGEFEQVTITKAAADAFCSFHVIEHVKDPQAHLHAALTAVRPGGIGLIATPNAGSWQQRVFTKLSPNFDSAHLRVFSKASLKRYAEKAGWVVETVHTPEYASNWLRVVSKAVRKLKGEDEEATAGKYSVVSPSLSAVYMLATALSWPLRKLQSLLGGGNEIFLVLRRPEE